jgi:hypothetical protein
MSESFIPEGDAIPLRHAAMPGQVTHMLDEATKWLLVCGQLLFQARRPDVSEKKLPNVLQKSPKMCIAEPVFWNNKYLNFSAKK